MGSERLGEVGDSLSRASRVGACGSVWVVGSMNAGTLRHVVEHALNKHLDGFGAWFPSGFDWQTLCSDAPEMARRLVTGGLEEEAGEDGDLAPELDLVEVAEEAFAFAYVGALASIALAVEDARDPDLLVERLTAPPSEAEEERFAELAADSLGSVERALAGQGEPLDEESVEGLAFTLTDAAWPGVEVALEGVEAFDPDRDVELPPSVKRVLGGVARVAAILAAFRWLGLQDDGAEGRG